MKKWIALMAALLLVTFCTAGLAQGKLTVTSKTVIIYSGRDSGVFVARVENTGNAPICYDNGTLVIFSEDDELLAAENYVSSSPSDVRLAPGEYTYIYEFLWSSPLKNARLGDVRFSVTSDSRGYSFDRIPASAVIDMPGSGSYSNYVNVTFTNNSEKVLYGAYVVCAMMDADDNVIFVNRNNYDNLGIHPGSTVTLKMYIDSDLVNYYEANGIVPVKVDALVYTNRSR